VHDALVGTLDQLNFLGTGELLVATQAPDCIPERSRALCGDVDRVIMLDTIFRAELESNHRIATDLSHGVVETEEFVRSQ